MKKGSILKSVLMGAMALTFAVGMVTLQQPNKVEALTSGWVQSGDYWYYYNNGTKLTGWQKISGYWYYFNDYGRMYEDGFGYIDGKEYYFNASGQLQMNCWIPMVEDWGDGEVYTYWYYADASGVLKESEWAYLSGHWYYFDGYAAVTSSWFQVDNVWYYFNASGQKTSTGSGLTGWQSMNGEWFYFIKPGVEAHGWQQISGKWYYFSADNYNGRYPGFMFSSGNWWIGSNMYYFNNDGSLATGWFRNWAGKWQYSSASGIVQYGWVKDAGKWYYIGDMVCDSYWCDNCEEYHYDYCTAMLTGWQEIDGSWYYFSSGGVMQTGWQKIGSYWYYFSPSGKMQTGWQKIGNCYYYFSEGGRMAVNTWIGNYHVNGNGVWDTSR